MRSKAIEAIVADQRLHLHLEVVEGAMNIADWLRQFETDDEDLKLIQVLGIRMFNAFGASLKLCCSGYYQNAALILRDVLETVFLVDLFRGDKSLIAKWRLADKASRMKQFKPVLVRTMLDDRDGFTERKRAAMYDLLTANGFVRVLTAQSRFDDWYVASRLLPRVEAVFSTPA